MGKTKFKALRVSSFLSKNLILSYCFLSLFSCHRISNDLNEVKLECGLSSVNLQGGRIFKFTTADNVKTLDSKTIRVSVLNQDGSSVAPSLSPKGCIIVSPDAKSIKVSASVDGESFGLAESLTGETESGIFSKKILKAIIEPQIVTACPVEGVFGRDFAENPFQILTNESDDALGFQILARSFATQTSFVIGEKKFGLKFDDSFQRLDIRNLLPGSYQLELSQASLATSLSESFQLLQDKVKSCVLTKVDSLPIFTELNEKSLFSVGAKIAAHQSGIQYHYCKIENAKEFSDSCQASSSCEDAMISADEIMAEKSGYFRYFAYMTDRSGQKSKTICQDLIVSETAPELTLQWSNPKYSQPSAYLEKPYSKIKLNIRTNHLQFGENSPQVKLMCRAEFSKANDLVLSGNSLKCLSDECKDKSLGVDVPCGRELELDLSGAWDHSELWDSVLTVTATSDDGLGHTSRSKASVLFPASAMGIREFRDSSDFMMAGNLFESDGTTAFVSGIRSRASLIRVFQGKSYFDIEAKNPNDSPVSAVKNMDGSFQTLWQSENGCLVGFHKISSSKLVTEYSDTDTGLCQGGIRGSASAPRIRCTDKGWFLKDESEEIYISRVGLLSKKERLSTQLSVSESCPKMIETKSSILVGNQELVQFYPSQRLDLVGAMFPYEDMLVDGINLINDEPYSYFLNGFQFFHDYRWRTLDSLIDGLKQVPSQDIMVDVADDDKTFLAFDVNSPDKKWGSLDWLNWTEFSSLNRMDGASPSDAGPQSSKELCEINVLFLFIEKKGCFKISLSNPTTLEFSKWDGDLKAFVPYTSVALDRKATEMFAIKDESAKLLATDSATVGIHVNMENPELPGISEIVIQNNSQVFLPQAKVYAIFGELVFATSAEQAFLIRDGRYGNTFKHDSRGRLWQKIENGFSVYDLN